MTEKIGNILTKTEIQFWLGIISVLLTAVYGFSCLKEDISLLRKDVQYLSQRVEEVNTKFSAVHTDNAQLSQVIFKLYENGTVASCNVFVKLYSDSGGLPGTLMATSDSLDPSAWGSTPGEKTFTFSGANKVNIYKGRTYHLEVAGDYTASDTNYVGFRNDVSGSYTPSGTETYNGESWSDPEATTDPYFKEYYDDTTIFSEGGNPMFFGGGLTLG